ncbi:hypothetical protein F4782DRAFT_165474 [Xylaria castorea]|nr:hypothetical protein F4782DRAFT_165474 [Xylaria castorea]
MFHKSACMPRNSSTLLTKTVMALLRFISSIGVHANATYSSDPMAYVTRLENPFLLIEDQLVQVVPVSGDDKEAESSDRWSQIVGADEIRNLFRDWPPHLAQAINELRCNHPEHHAMYLWEHPPARSYASGPMCAVDYAAHAYDTVASLRRWHVLLK